MRKVGSLQEYYALVNGAKSRHGSLKTNCILFPDALDRYIQLGRLLWEELDAGMMFYSDEETFYQAYFYINPSLPFSVSRKDKPVLLQNVYKGEKKPWVLSMEKALQNSGFVLQDPLMHGVVPDDSHVQQIRKTARLIERIFQKEGLTYAKLRRDQIPEMLAFRKTIDEIPFYAFPYFTDDELMEEAEAERLCCIMDRDGRIIGARHLIVNGKKAYGWVGVEEKYKTMYGVATMFLLHAFDYFYANGVKMCAWVKSRNTPSIQYHERLGMEWTGHMEDEWLLDGTDSNG